MEANIIGPSCWLCDVVFRPMCVGYYSSFAIDQSVLKFYNIRFIGQETTVAVLFSEQCYGHTKITKYIQYITISLHA